MTNTTTDTITVGSLVLNTLGYNVAALPVGRTAREPRFQRIPRRAGAMWSPSRPQPTELDIDLWVSDRDADGAPGGASQMWANVDAILAACGSPGELVTLTRVRASTTLIAEGELIGPVAPTLIAPGALRMTLPFLLPYPFWLGAQVSTLLTGGDGTVTNAGQVAATDVLVQLEAGGSPWVDPVVSNGANGVSLTYDGTIPAGATVTVDLHDGTVLQGATSVSGAVTVNGSVFSLAVGDNAITTTEASGSGNVRVVFRPPFVL